jgi:hypothetical protein
LRKKEGEESGVDENERGMTIREKEMLSGEREYLEEYENETEKVQGLTAGLLTTTC